MHSLTKVLYIQRSLPCDMLSSVILKRTGSVKSKNFCFGHFPCVLLLEEIERFSLFMTTVSFFITKNFVSVSSHVKIRLVFGIVSVSFSIVTKTPYAVVMSTGTVVTWSAGPQGLAPTTFSMKPTKHQKASTSSSIRNNIGERRSLMPCT